MNIEMAYKVVEYVWIGGNDELRSKARILNMYNESENVIPTWNYDGSSTNQAEGSNSEIFINPRKLFRCPFRRDNGFIVMCDTYNSKNEPLPNNHRVKANEIFNKYLDQVPWYGLEQEFFIYDRKTNLPVGFDSNNKQGQFYCSVGANNIFCRNIVEEHLEACLYAGINISGINSEVAPSQFEFQIGPVEGIDVADQLWIARYILERISEKYDKFIVYHPKPLEGNWNGSGCHINFSTKAMREDNGIALIYEAINKLSKNHKEHMQIYGKFNEKRMTGLHETANFHNFSSGVANRTCSIRIPIDTVTNGKGYFEDRRPAANIDPYQCTSKLLETVMN